jgi:hypothetical protein
MENGMNGGVEMDLCSSIDAKCRVPRGVKKGLRCSYGSMDDQELVPGSVHQDLFEGISDFMVTHSGKDRLFAELHGRVARGEMSLDVFSRLMIEISGYYLSEL